MTTPSPTAPARTRTHRSAPDAGPNAAEVRAIALALTRERGSVRNRDLRGACGVTSQQAWRALRALVTSGHLVRSGRGNRDAAYQLP